jgi:hypothetical protein
MKTRQTTTATTTTPTALPAAAPELGLPLLFGLLLGLLFITGFMYPAGAYPLQSMLFSAIMVVAAAGLCLRLLLAGGPARALLAAGLGSLPALSLFLFILWAALRWRQAEVPALERDWIIALAGLGVAFVLGCGAGVLDRSAPAQLSVFRTFSRLAAVGAIGFGCLALYQFLIGYPEAYRLLKEQQSGPIMDLQTQSLLRALELRRVAGRLGNPNLFAAQLALFIFFSLAALRRPAGRGWRLAGWLGVAAGLAALLLSQSRGGMLTVLLAAGLGGALLLAGRRGAQPGRVEPLAIVLLGGALLCATSSSWAGGGILERIGNIDTIRERLYFWQIAGKVWAGHPLVGEGPGGFALLYLTLKSPVARESQYAHSWLFQIGSELGLIGLGLFGAAWAGLIARVGAAWRRGGLHTDAPWCLVAVLILLFNGLFEFSLQWPAFLTALGLFGGLACGLTAPMRNAVSKAHWAFSLGMRNRIFCGRGVAGVVLVTLIAIMSLWIGVPHALGELHRGYAEAYADDRNWRVAAEHYRQALAWQPDNPALYMAQAGVLGQLGAADRAWALMGEAERLNPRSAAVRGAQANWLAAQHRLDEAIQRVGQAIELYPSNVAYRLDRARFYLQTGRQGQAREDLLLIERGRLPVWEFQQGGYNELRAAAGLKRIPLAEIPK